MLRIKPKDIEEFQSLPGKIEKSEDGIRQKKLDQKKYQHDLVIINDEIKTVEQNKSILLSQIAILELDRQIHLARQIIEPIDELLGMYSSRLETIMQQNLSNDKSIAQLDVLIGKCKRYLETYNKIMQARQIKAEVEHKANEWKGHVEDRLKRIKSYEEQLANFNTSKVAMENECRNLHDKLENSKKVINEEAKLIASLKPQDSGAGKISPLNPTERKSLGAREKKNQERILDLEELEARYQQLKDQLTVLSEQIDDIDVEKHDAENFIKTVRLRHIAPLEIEIKKHKNVIDSYPDFDTSNEEHKRVEANLKNSENELMQCQLKKVSFEKDKLAIELNISKNQVLKSKQEKIMREAEERRQPHVQWVGSIPQGSTLESLKASQKEINLKQSALAERKRDIESNKQRVQSELNSQINFNEQLQAWLQSYHSNHALVAFCKNPLHSFNLLVENIESTLAAYDREYPAGQKETVRRRIFEIKSEIKNAKESLATKEEKHGAELNVFYNEQQQYFKLCSVLHESKQNSGCEILNAKLDAIFTSNNLLNVDIAVVRGCYEIPFAKFMSEERQEYQDALDVFKRAVTQRYQASSAMPGDFDLKAAAIEEARKNDPNFDIKYCKIILIRATELLQQNHQNPKIELDKLAAFNKKSPYQKGACILLAFLGAVATLVSALTLPPMYAAGVATVSFFGCAAILNYRNVTTKAIGFVAASTERAVRQAVS